MAHTGLLTPVGYLTVFSEDGAIVAIEFGRATVADALDEVSERARQQLNAYFAGHLQDFDLPLNPAGNTFQQAVWRAMLEIPFGHTRTYGDIAKDVGRPAQAVGGACGANPIPIVIPCHRVLGQGGRLVGYSGGEGAETKQALLQLEGALLI